MILTRDEERALPHALASLPAGANVLVLDALSSDATVQIAGEAGARVVERAWTDFVDARRFALAHVTTRWAFMLDADERLSAELRAALTSAPAADAYAVTRATSFCGRVVRAFGWDCERIVRVISPGAVRIEAHAAAGGSAALHECWIPAGEVRELGGILEHDSYPDTVSYQRKFACYTSLEAQGLAPNPLAFFAQSLRAFARFGWLMTRRGGWRIGWRGWYIAFFSAAYPVVAHWKALGRR